ncbi:HesA/MoeB/ThiF family protein [Thermopolyspora sp. NPDC052614]|uniref:HesA/MoeB/ThiF family protein n=1 Tax=Thermopolyspora sp. NPDC052614 TaxID=3155682 RepID=UPI003429EB56
MLPRVKAEHAPYRLSDSRVRIGGDIYGIASEIEDPGGLAWAALNLMDGTRTQDDIVDALTALFPELPVTSVARIVDALVRSGHIEDANSAAPEELTPREQERYLRNRDFFRWVDLSPHGNPWHPQLRLKSARVVVIGLGGTGTHAVWSLAAAGVGRVHCVDSDTVELSNLNRQILYTEADIGRRKVDVALRRLKAVNSDITITGENRRIDGQEALLPLLADCDVLALCADEPRGEAGLRHWANRACLSAGVPWVGGGYSGPLVSTCVTGPGGPCFECLQHAAEQERRRKGHPATADFGWPGVLATTAALSGQLIAQAVISLLTEIPRIAPGYLTGINVIAPDQHFFVRPERRADCPVCAS